MSEGEARATAREYAAYLVACSQTSLPGTKETVRAHARMADKVLAFLASDEADRRLSKVVGAAGALAVIEAICKVGLE